VRLYIVRHAQRADTGEPTYAGDPEAELTPEGEKQARKLGRWMADKEEIPAIIIASPAVRTQETAEAIVEEIEKAGFAPPKIKTDVSMGPHMSIRGAVLNAAADKSMKRVLIVSHHESISNGLRELRRTADGKEREVSPHLDQMAMAELRIFRVRRKNGDWEEKRRLLPSDISLCDYY